MYSGALLFCALVTLMATTVESADNRRPIYLIGHQTNSLGSVIPYLKNGANVLESDVQFNPDGTVLEIFHGCNITHDCFTDCNQRGQLAEYLSYLRNITDPKNENSFYDKLIMQFFDLKLDSSKDLKKSGQEIAKHVMNYLWSNGEREQEIRVLFYTNEVDKKDAIIGFLQEFKDQGKESQLKNVGFDGGMGNLDEIKEEFQDLKLDHIWLGDGTINCLSAFHPAGRLKAEIKIRNDKGFIKKVYDWTVDVKFKYRLSLDLGVDGFITNTPARLSQVLEEPKYKKTLRPATINDPPFERFDG